MLIALIIADVLMAGIFAWRFTMLPPQIPLFYSEIWGENQLVDFWFIILIPLLLHIFIFFNRFIYYKFFWQNHTVKNIINVVNWSWTIIFTGIFLRILFLVT